MKSIIAIILIISRNIWISIVLSENKKFLDRLIKMCYYTFKEQLMKRSFII